MTEAVSLEAHELFSQLCAVSHMAKMAPQRRVIQSFIELSDGTIRVFRDWLSKHANSDKNGKPISSLHPLDDSSVLWVNNCNNNVGIKFRVRERKWRQGNPILFASDEEVAVSYEIEYEGISVRRPSRLQAKALTNL